jgi:uncharacterized oxidoreductase
MSAAMKTILVIGGTGGIGEAFARRWHMQGKKIILTGRREERLKQIQNDLPGCEILVMDNSDLASLPQKVNEITSKFPALDTVWVNSGIQKTYQVGQQLPFLALQDQVFMLMILQIDDASTSSDKAIADEITTNVTAPMILGRLFMPHLINVGGTFMITSSGLAFVPMGIYPTCEYLVLV